MTIDADSALRVLVVDDQPDTVFPQLVDVDDVLSIVIREPDAVLESDLDKVDLILVDYLIDRWPGRDELESVALKPLDGLALAGVLRSYTSSHRETPVAIALHAANLDELAAGMGTQSREHVIARLHSLEWAFRKASNGSGVPKADQLRSLAEAVRALPAIWPDDEDAWDVATDLFGLPEESAWLDQARLDFENCYPPIHELASATHGLALLRWLLHRILPYPAFLRSAEYLALGLRVTPLSLSRALDARDEQLLGRLESIRYKGILQGFLGDRWWKAGIEDLLWEITEGEPFDRSRLAAAVNEELSQELEPVEQKQPVVCVDQRLRPTLDLIERAEAVEIQPDDWPSYAQSPWAPLKLVRETPALRALVVEEDRERIAMNGAAS